MRPLGRQVQLEPFNGDQPIALGIVRTKDWTQCARADLMKNPKWTETIGGRATGSFR